MFDNDAVPVADHEGMCEVVNVLTCAAKVYKLADGVELRIAFHRFLEEVFDGFDIVIGPRLDRFNSLGLRFIEFSDDAFKQAGRFTAKQGHLEDIGTLRQRLEPSHLDFNTSFDESEFGEDIAQGIHFSVIAAIQW